MNAVARAQLTFQMLTLLQKYPWLNFNGENHNINIIKTISRRSPNEELVTRPLARVTARTAAKPIVWCAPGRQCPKVHERNPTVLVWAIAGSRQAKSECYGHFKFGAQNILQHAWPQRAILLALYFSHAIQRTDLICFELSFRLRLVNYSWWLMEWNCWWSGFVSSM